MKVLFTHSYFLELDPKQLKMRTPFPPLATLYAAAVLREKGFNVKLADLQFAASATDIEKHIRDYSPDVLVIYDDSFNYLTKMCLTNMRKAAFEMQAIAKKNNVPVIVSSSDATDHLEKYFLQGADFIIIGEAEQTLLELVQALQNNKQPDLSLIDGLAVYRNKTLLKSKPRLVLKNLDELALPAWNLLNIVPYRNTWMKHHGYFSINMVTTRGCPYKCNWCAKPVYGNRYNSHSAERIVAQIKELQPFFGFTHIWFADDIFGLKPGWIEEFNLQIKKQQIKISFKIQSRADLLLNDTTVKNLAESGCKEVWMGAESGSQKILDAMEKGTTLEQVKNATLLLNKYGIKPCFFLQFGYPGEKMNDIHKTMNMLEELKPHDLGISISYPLPGTKFYEKVKTELSTKQNWNDSDDLDLMFKSTFTREFYKVLQRFVHYNFRAQQAVYEAKHLRFTKRAMLGPYYFTKRAFLKRKLKSLEANATSLF